MARDEEDEEVSHTEELNDQMDAGGCTEAWESMADIRDDDGISRRKVLKGTATFSIAMLGSGTAVGASSSDEEPLVTTLNNDKAQRVFEDLSKEPKYGQLKERVTERGEQLRSDEATIIRVEGEKTAVIADVPIENTEAEEAHLVIGRDEETGEILGASLEYDETKVNGMATTKTTLDITGGMPFEKTTQEFDPKPAQDLEKDD